MRDSLHSLTDREKETLRLLLAGHDAKSAAREQQLSVHTVNERLRHARRKLGVSSSREAARLLGEAERQGPEFLADKEIGVAAAPRLMASSDQPDRRQGAAPRLAWLAGGMLIMSLVIAAVVLSSVIQQGGPVEAQEFQRTPAAAPAAGAAQSANALLAREWLALVDGKQWDESWREAADMFRAQVPTATWSAQIRQVREPLGAVASRTLESTTKTNALPGAPDGEYEMLQFRTAFANQGGAIETVVLVRDGAAWKVAGYFIR